MPKKQPKPKPKVCVMRGHWGWGQPWYWQGHRIAAGLAKAGGVVYITGRTPTSTKNAPGTLAGAAEEINTAAPDGRCIGVQCDHSDDVAVEALFKRVIDKNGRIDVLVNNAYGAVITVMETGGKTFWEKDPWVWDASNDVGLRSHYVASVFAARQMVSAKKGLIVNVSSFGGWRYAGFATDVAYGVGKAASDRMANDMAVELQKHNVAAVSL
jgi:NAD(P)-dependent dehydrogenase (short-subunit alcohol dehydrogenase family)